MVGVDDVDGDDVVCVLEELEEVVCSVVWVEVDVEVEDFDDEVVVLEEVVGLGVGVSFLEDDVLVFLSSSPSSSPPPPPPKVHDPVRTPSLSEPSCLNSPVVKSRPPNGQPGHYSE